MKRILDDNHISPRKQQDKRVGRKREVTTVLVSNLPKSYNQSKTRKYFQDCGNIKHVDICESLLKDTRSARIEFTDYSEVLSALTKTYNKIGNREIKVEPLTDCTLWIANFPPRYNAKDIKELFSKQQILTISVRLPSLRFNPNRRFAYVDLTSFRDVDRAIQDLNGKNIEDYSLVVKKSNVLNKSERSDAGLQEKREIIIKHLNFKELTTEQLRGYFSEYGEIESVKIPNLQEEKLSDGYAFITFTDQSAAKASLDANQNTMGSQKITVKLSDKKEYLERQKVKRILSSARENEDIVSLFPISDKISKAQVECLFSTKMGLVKSDIKQIYLVTDYQGALVVLKSAAMAAKCMMSLNYTEFEGKTVQCGTIGDIKRYSRKVEDTARTDNPHQSISRPPTMIDEKTSKLKLTNDDFRKLFLGT